MIDPYFDWLGIPRSQRPPSPYALLGISPNETDADAIADAALLRVLQLGPQKRGPHGELCADLIKQINEAKALLLNPAKRAEYEKNPKLFRKELKPAAPVEAAPDVDLADDDLTDPESEEAPKAGGAWWSDASPDAAPKPKRAAPSTSRPSWLPEEEKPNVIPFPQPAAKPAPSLSPLTRGGGFDEFTTKHYAPPKKGNGKLFVLAGLVLALAGGAAAVYFTQADKEDPKKVVIDNKGKPPVGPKDDDKGKQTVEPKDKQPVEPKDKQPVQPKGKPPVEPVASKAAWRNEVRTAHQASVRFLAIRKDGTAAFSAGDDQKILMHTPGGAEVETLGSLPSPTRALALFPKGDLLAASDGGNIVVIDTHSKRTPHRFLNPRGGVRCMVASADGTVLYTGTTAGEIVYWNLADGKESSTGVIAGKEQIVALALSPDGTQLLAGTTDGTILRITTASNAMANKWKANTRNKGIVGLDWSKAGTTALSLSEDNELATWTPVSGMKVMASGPSKETILAALFDPQEKAVLVASADAGFASRTIIDLKPIPGGKKTAGKPNALAVNASSTVVLLGLADGTVQVFSQEPQDGGNLALAPLPPTPLSVPTAGEMATAIKILRESEKPMLDAANTVEARGALAARFAHTAETVDKAPEARKAYFDLALEQHVRNLDFAGAGGVITRAAQWFAVDPEIEWVGFIEKVGERAPNAYLGQLATHCLEFLNRWDAEKRFDAVARVLPVAEMAARLSSSEVAMRRVAALKEQVSATELEEGRAVEAMRKLQASPNDAENNRIVGSFEFFRRKDFDTALPRLVKGDNAALKKLAMQDLADPKEARGMVEVGNAWWNSGQDADIAPDDDSKLACWTRAKQWYDKAMATTLLSAVDKIDISGRALQLKDLGQKLAAKAPAPKGKSTASPSGNDGIARFNTLLLGTEKTVTGNWTLVGARIQTDGVLFTEAGTMTTRFTVGDNWRMVLTAQPGATGITVDAHDTKLVLPPGMGNASVTYTIERKGNKLSYDSNGANAKSPVPLKTTVILTDDKLAATPIVVHPTRNPPAQGLLMKSAVFSGTIRLVKE